MTGNYTLLFASYLAETSHRRVEHRVCLRLCMLRSVMYYAYAYLYCKVLNSIMKAIDWVPD
jgi:hypothetical protein